MSTLSLLIDLVALDLRDTGNANWSSDEITQHIRRALLDIDDLQPQRLVATVSCAGGAREYDLSALPGILSVYDLWYPYDAANADEQPQRPSWQPLHGGTIYLDIASAPTTGEAMRVFYLARHTLSGLDGASATTLNVRQQSAIVLGATYLAAQQYAQDVIGAVTPSGWTPKQLGEWAERRERTYRRALEEIRRAEVLMHDPRIPWIAAGRQDGRGGAV